MWIASSRITSATQLRYRPPSVGAVGGPLTRRVQHLPFYATECRAPERSAPFAFYGEGDDD